MEGMVVIRRCSPPGSNKASGSGAGRATGAGSARRSGRMGGKRGGGLAARGDADALEAAIGVTALAEGHGEGGQGGGTDQGPAEGETRHGTGR